MNLPALQRAPSRLDRVILALSLAAFVGLGVWMSERMMVFSEEFITMPMPAGRVVSQQASEGGQIRYEPSCLTEPDTLFLLSGERPTLSLCLGGRSFPVMSAPHFSGLFLWPVTLLRSFHHDNPFVIRKLLLPLGMLSIALTYRLIARFAGPRLGVLGALGMAISPCFVFISSIIQNFETMPWIFLVGAMLLLAGCPELAPPREGQLASDKAPSTARLVGGALCVGLAGLANIKAVFLVVPLLAFALRFGLQVRSIRKEQWAMMIGAGLAALLPMAAPIVMDPSMRWAQGREGRWFSSLLLNIERPQRILEATGDLLLFWSNIGHYLAHVRLDLPSLVVAGGVFVFVVFDTIRTLRRRRGCVVTAACGVLMLSYVLVVTLLYADFPANYAPLHAVYGIALGCAVARLFEVLRPRVPGPVAAVLAAALLVPFVVDTVESTRALGALPFVTNSRAEQDLARFLVDHPEPDSKVWSINLLSGGVVDALSGGTVHTTQAHKWLGVCERGLPDKGAECFHERWKALLAAEAGTGGVRVIFPTDLTLVHRPGWLLPMQHEQLERAARELGFETLLEQTFSTPDGVPACHLYRVRPPRG